MDKSAQSRVHFKCMVSPKLARPPRPDDELDDSGRERLGRSLTLVVQGLPGYWVIVAGMKGGVAIVCAAVLLESVGTCNSQ